MKIGIFLILVLGLAVNVFADTTAEIVDIDLDDNGNIRVWTCHKIDGVEVQSQYPKIDGHYVYCTRYSGQNFLDCKDKKEIEAYIINDIKNHTYNLVQKEFDKKALKTYREIKVDYNGAANQTFIDSNLDEIVGKKTSASEVTYEIDTDNDGVKDKEITLKQDGTKVETSITP